MEIKMLFNFQKFPELIIDIKIINLLSICCAELTQNRKFHKKMIFIIAYCINIFTTSEASKAVTYSKQNFYTFFI